MRIREVILAAEALHDAHTRNVQPARKFNNLIVIRGKGGFERLRKATCQSSALLSKTRGIADRQGKGHWMAAMQDIGYLIFRWTIRQVHDENHTLPADPRRRMAEF